MTLYFITMFPSKEGSKKVFTPERGAKKTLSWAKEVFQIIESGACNVLY